MHHVSKVILVATGLVALAGTSSAQQPAEVSCVCAVDCPRGDKWVRVYGWATPKPGVRIYIDEMEIRPGALGLVPKVVGGVGDKSDHPRDVRIDASGPQGQEKWYDLRGGSKVPEKQGREVAGSLPVYTKTRDAERELVVPKAVVPATPKAVVPSAPKAAEVKVRKIWIYKGGYDGCYFCKVLAADLLRWKDFQDGVRNGGIEFKDGPVEEAPFAKDYLESIEGAPVLWAGYFDDSGKKVCTVEIRGWDAAAPCTLDGRKTDLMTALQWRVYALRVAERPSLATFVYPPRQQAASR